MTETPMVPHGAEYDESLSELSVTQLWAALIACEAELGRRIDVWTAAREQIDAHLLVCGNDYAYIADGKMDMAYSELLVSAAFAAEQGRMLSAINRALHARAGYQPKP